MGIRVDPAFLNRIDEELTVALRTEKEKARQSAPEAFESVEADLYDKALSSRKSEAGKARVVKPEFNFASPSQKVALLFNKLGLPIVNYTPKGSPKAGKDELEELQHLHPVAESLRSINQYNAYKSNFTQGLLKRLEGGRVYPSFNVAGTDTGRISHSAPNMGNMPARDPKWNKIRGIFLPDEGQVINKADYGQMEICIAAHYSGDRNLLKIVNDGASMHDITSQELGISRTDAKPVNFGLQYGGTRFLLMRLLGVSESEATHLYNKYWETYKGQKALIEACGKKVDRGEPIVSLFGRVRHFTKKKRRKGNKDYRKAYSALVQGTAADLTSMAFYEAVERFSKRGWIGPGWTVHDELIMSARKDVWEQSLQEMTCIMVDVGVKSKLTVPLSVDPEGGLERWAK